MVLLHGAVRCVTSHACLPPLPHSCPAIIAAGQNSSSSQTFLSWSIDPAYYLYYGCNCDSVSDGAQRVQAAALGGSERSGPPCRHQTSPVCAPLPAVSHSPAPLAELGTAHTGHTVKRILAGDLLPAPHAS